jgi:hypothetical protein
LKAVDHIAGSSTDTMGAFNSCFDTVSSAETTGAINMGFGGVSLHRLT